jgi:signal transduction histidine kinase
LRTCLLNLIDNSVRHGIPPVEVRVYPSGDYLTIAVGDGGRLTSGFSLDLPRRQSPGSQGLGFGLEIVQKILAELGGYLSFEPSPTRFCLNLRRHPQ